MISDVALSTTLTRISRLGEPYALAVAPDDEGWIPAEDLVGGGRLFDDIIERIGGAQGPSTRRAIGSQFVLLYLRFVWPAVAAFALERRVPDVGAANLLVRLDGDGWPAAFALKELRFAVLAGDPAADDATVVAGDPSELLEWLQERAIEANAAPLIETVRGHLLTSGTALWGNVAAAFVHPLLWHVQHVAPESTSVVRDAEAILQRATAPRLGDQVRLLRVVDGDDAWTVHARRTCCLRWCLPGESRCDDCPLVREPQASAFLRERLTEAIAHGEALRADLGMAERRGDDEREARPA
ncbi:MAG: IucA/IucC family C-terminal-domain containing protein [Candidatus Limnocylindria bacterium]